MASEAPIINNELIIENCMVFATGKPEAIMHVIDIYSKLHAHGFLFS